MKYTALAAMLLAVVALPASAADANRKTESQTQSSAQASALAEGEVRKVDKDGQKITLRHGPLPDLDMPKPMTMVYRVKDPAMLERVTAGDKVRFQAEKVAGGFQITKIEPVQ
jgi:Cu/Ag efflux protein CusF